MQVPARSPAAFGSGGSQRGSGRHLCYRIRYAGRVPSTARQDYRDVISANVKALMASHPRIQSQQALVRASGLPVMTVSRIVNGAAETGINKLVAVADAFGVPLDVLLGREVATLPLEGLDLKVRSRLSSLQLGFLETAQRLLIQGKLGDGDCVRLLAAWLELDAKNEA